MKTKKRFLLPIICVIAFAMMFTLSAVAFVGCGGGNSITSIELSQTTVTAFTGDTVDLSVMAKYSDGTTKKLSAKDGYTWASDNESVATVSATGKVTVKAKGEANITVTVDKLSQSCKVTVKEMTVELDETSIKLNKGEKKQLAATAKVDGAVDDTVEIEWSSSDEEVATVESDGTVTGWADGTATITAKRKGGNQSDTCEVEVEWEKPVGYNPVEWAEQNKIHPNAWGYWNAKEASWAGGALATDHGVYTDETFVESDSTLKDGYEYIGMGKATFEFTITNPGVNYVYQVFYRSSDNYLEEGRGEGKLHFNHNYEMTLKIKSTVAGEIHVNSYDDVAAKEDEESVEDYNAYLLECEENGQIMLAKDEEDEYVTDKGGVYVTKHDFELEENVEQELHLIFRHDDCGYIYQDGIYDNMGSALHLQLGDLTSNQRVSLSVWDIQYKDLGEATNPIECDETKHGGYIDPYGTNVPDDLVIPEEWNVLKGDITATKASIVEESNKVIFKLEGTLTLSAFNDEAAAEEYLEAYYFDGQECGGSWNRRYFNVVDVDVTTDGNFTIKYDITYLGTFSGGETFTCHFGTTGTTGQDADLVDLKLDAGSAVHDSGVTANGKKYTISNIPNGTDQATNWGCTSIRVVKAQA